MQLLLHIGVHKTATTYLQSALQRSRITIESSGTSLWTPKELRANGLSFQSRLGLPDHPRLAAQVLSQMAEKRARLLVSEENILRAAHPKSGGIADALYSKAALALTQLAEACPDQPIDLVLSLRNYAGFYRSLYCQYLLAGRMMSFDRFLQETRYPLGRWVDVVEQMGRVKTVKSLTIWSYEDFGRLQSQITDCLVPQLKGGLDWPNEAHHAGLSLQAVGAIQAREREDPTPRNPEGRKERMRRARVIRRTYPVGSTYAAFAPWSDAELEDSTKRYAHDRLKIEAMRKVTWLSP